MKKLAVILSTVLTVSFNLDAFGGHTYLICRANGQALIYDSNGNTHYAGGCAGGPWAYSLDLVVPIGNPSISEASTAIYEALNALPSDPMTPSSTELEEIEAAINDNPVAVWVNPLKLNAAAYALIYGGTTNLPMFYVNTSIDVASGDNALALYSDMDREITVTYKTLDLTIISSEVISILEGSNSKMLNTASLANGTYIITVSTSENYSVNLTLYVNH